MVPFRQRHGSEDVEFNESSMEFNPWTGSLVLIVSLRTLQRCLLKPPMDEWKQLRSKTVSQELQKNVTHYAFSAKECCPNKLNE